MTLHEWITQGDKTRRSSTAKRPLEGNGCQKRSEKEGSRLHCGQVARGWKVSKFSECSWMDRRFLPILGPSPTPHPGTRGTSTKTPSRCRQAGPMRARKDFKSTSQTLTSLRQEQGRQNLSSPENERARERPFDEALRADLEWQRQYWKTCWSQLSSS